MAIRGDINHTADDLITSEKQFTVDVESSTGTELDAELLSWGLELGTSGSLQWRKDSRDHPRNWSLGRKTYDTVIIILLEFYTTVISTTGTSAASLAAPEYDIDYRVSLVAFTFMYQLGQAFGGCLMPPFSESFGRRNPYIFSCAAFSIFSILTGRAPNLISIGIGRFVSGFASSVPSVVIAGSVEDIFNTKWRVWIVVIWNAATTAGLCFGPIYSVYLADALGWRWVYYSSAIVTGVLFAALLAIKESRPSRIMVKKLKKLEKETTIINLHFDNPDLTPDLHTLVEVVLVRPLRLLATEPLVMMVATISAISWGIIYLFTESLNRVYVSMGFSSKEASLVFLAIAVGVLFTFLPRFWDMKIVRQKNRRGEHVEPEDKVMGFTFAAPALAIGLIWFAWTVPPLGPHVHWLAPTASLVLVGFGVNEMAYTLSGYLADAYLLYAASAFSGLAFVRAIVSGVMPLVAYELYGNLNANFAGSILAGVALLFCIAPVVFLKYSRQLRARSKFAKYSLEVHLRTQIDKD